MKRRTTVMPSLKSIVWLVLLGLLMVEPSHAYEIGECPYEKGRTIEDLPAELAAHEEWVKKRGWENPDIPGRANFCKATLVEANLEGANLLRANLEGANLTGANLSDAVLRKANLNEADLSGVG